MPDHRSASFAGAAREGFVGEWRSSRPRCCSWYAIRKASSAEHSSRHAWGSLHCIRLATSSVGYGRSWRRSFLLPKPASVVCYLKFSFDQTAQSRSPSSKYIYYPMAQRRGTYSPAGMFPFPQSDSILLDNLIWLETDVKVSSIAHGSAESKIEYEKETAFTDGKGNTRGPIHSHPLCTWLSLCNSSRWKGGKHRCCYWIWEKERKHKWWSRLGNRKRSPRWANHTRANDVKQFQTWPRLGEMEIHCFQLGFEHQERAYAWHVGRTWEETSCKLDVGFISLEIPACCPHHLLKILTMPTALASTIQLILVHTLWKTSFK